MTGSEPPRVSLQISLSPGDLRHAREIVPHQLRQLGGQVAEVVLTIDTQPGTGKFGVQWAERQAGMTAFLDALAASRDDLRVSAVDYSASAAQRVADMFFAGHPVPPKDYRGGPFYCYFYGLYDARHDWVLHLDCDMLLGGGSQTWVAEALEILERHEGVLACSPLPGPPRDDLRLNATQHHTSDAHLDSVLPSAFRFSKLSTRIYLLDRRRLATLGGSRFAAQLEAGPALFPEMIISAEMERTGLARLDFLGNPPGMWAVHPWARDADFHARLPALIDRIEAGDVTDDQRGTGELSLGMLQRRRGFRYYSRIPGYRRLPWLRMAARAPAPRQVLSPLR